MFPYHVDPDELAEQMTSVAARIVAADATGTGLELTRCEVMVLAALFEAGRNFEERLNDEQIAEQAKHALGRSYGRRLTRDS